MNLITIKKSLQPMIISSFWAMLRECEAQAENNDDRMLKHQVEGYYRQWNLMTGNDQVPRWIKRVIESGNPCIRTRVRAIVAENLGLQDSDLRDDVSMATLGGDSLDCVEIIIALEDEFKIEITDTDAETMWSRSIDGAVTWIREKL